MTYQPSIAERISWTTALGPHEAKVLQALASCGDWMTGRRCYPRLSTLVTRSGVSRATVTRCLRRLEDPAQEGGPWIIAIARRHRHSTTYDICVDRLATCPAKEQQTTMDTAIDYRSEAHAEPQPVLDHRSEAHAEPQAGRSEAHAEPPTSDPIKILPKTLIPRADAGLPFIGVVQPVKCTDRSHAWCDRRIHIPKKFHLQLLHRLDTRLGEAPITKEERLFAIYGDAMAHLPETESIPDVFKFLEKAFAARTETQNPAQPTARGRARPTPAYNMPREKYTQAAADLRKRGGRW